MRMFMFYIVLVATSHFHVNITISKVWIFYERFNFTFLLLSNKVHNMLIIQQMFFLLLL